MDLTKPQMDAVCHYKGPAIVTAGPGSGKTSVIVLHILHLIRCCHVHPDQILVLTFTRAAAEEMSSRFLEICQDHTINPVFGTFHSVFFRMLKDSGRFPLKLISDIEKSRIIRSLLKQLQIDSDKPDNLVKHILSAISRAKNGGNRKETSVAGLLSSEQFQMLIHSYQQALTEVQALDYDDILLRMKQLFIDHPDTVSKWQNRFSFILVDEFQDLNRIQYDILKLLAFPQNNLFVVGDKNQCIYGFRGSQPELMKQFLNDYPKSRSIFLDRNFRCAEVINKAALKLLDAGAENAGNHMHSGSACSEGDFRITPYRDCKEEYMEIADQIKELQKTGISYDQMTILLRGRRDIPYICGLFTAKEIPYTTGDQKDPFLSHFIVKDILAYLKAAKGIASRSDLLRLLNCFCVWIPRHSIPEHPDTNWISQILSDYNNDLIVETALLRLKEHLSFLKKLSSFAAVEYIFHVLGYKNFLEEYGHQLRLFPGFYDPVTSSLRNKAKEYPNQERFLKILAGEERKEDVTIPSAANESVVIQTMHASKGLEYDVVFIPDLNKGVMPASRSENDHPEEERRLLYVAMTRARIMLCLSYVEYTHGKKVSPSVFINDLRD